MSNDVTKAVFLADAHRGSGVTKVVVKFAHKYSEEGHMLLVAALQAPKLHYAGLRPVSRCGSSSCITSRVRR